MGGRRTRKPSGFFDIPSKLPAIEETRQEGVARTGIVDRVDVEDWEPVSTARTLQDTTVRPQLDTEHLKIMVGEIIQDRVRVR